MCTRVLSVKKSRLKLGSPSVPFPFFPSPLFEPLPEAAVTQSLRVYSSKHLGTRPVPGRTPPCATLLQGVEIARVPHNPVSGTGLLTQLSSGCGDHCTTPCGSGSAPLSHCLTPLPVTFSPLQLQCSQALSTPSYQR